MGRVLWFLPFLAVCRLLRAAATVAAHALVAEARLFSPRERRGTDTTVTC